MDRRGDGVLSFLSRKKIEKEVNLERMIDEYGNEVLRIAYMYLRDMQRAEDAFQEVFLRVFKNGESFRGESSEKTWIIRITINVCKDLLKSFWLKKVVPGEELALMRTERDVEDEVLETVENQRLYQKILSLPPTYKEVIILYYYQNFNTVEIASILGVSEGTVRSRLARARDMLKKHIVERSEMIE
jgi:RNA polymerase sigma-70 factor, ECF subfamily